MDNSKETPTLCSKQSMTDDSAPLNQDIPYRSAVVALLYAAITTRQDIAYAVGVANQQSNRKRLVKC